MTTMATRSTYLDRRIDTLSKAIEEVRGWMATGRCTEEEGKSTLRVYIRRMAKLKRLKQKLAD